jgi:hypothetical protein
MFTVLFALARTVGWIAQWNEMIEDPQQRIGRPRQLYIGEPQRDYSRFPSANRLQEIANKKPGQKWPGFFCLMTSRTTSGGMFAGRLFRLHPLPDES